MYSVYRLLTDYQVSSLKSVTLRYKLESTPEFPTVHIFSTMYIRELSERTGITPDTIRFYEKLKLIQGHRQYRQGHRQYDESHVTTLIQIKFAKAMGFTLKDIQEKLADWHTGRLTEEDKREILTAQLQKMDEAAAQIEQVRQYLRNKIDSLHCHSLQIPNLAEIPQLATLPD